MKKINREKSAKLLAIRALATALSAVLIAPISGCAKKPSNLTQDEMQLINDDIGKMNRLKDMYDISYDMNKYFKENNIEGELKEKDGIKYINYPADYLRVNDEKLEIDELKESIKELDNMSYKGKIEQMNLVNVEINTCNLLTSYEHLYRLILTYATGIDYITSKDNEEYIKYIIEGENITKKSNDAIETLMVNYIIDENNATLLSYLIDNKPRIKELNKLMAEDPKFGPEDHIINYNNNQIIDTYYQVLSRFYEINNINNKKYTKKKTK